MAAFTDNVYRGLNVGKALSDINDSAVALANIGLKKVNLDLIRNLSDRITRQEFHNLSGLVDDQKRILESLVSASIEAKRITVDMRSVSSDQLFNFSINSRLVAGTIKYNYINFDGQSGWELKSADISTSRVSSWSPFGPEDNPDQFITYNSEVLNTGEFLALTELGITTQPQEKQYISQTATNKLTLNINGENVQFPVMRGIPFRFKMGTSDLYVNMSFVKPLLTAGSSVVHPSFEKTNIATGIKTFPDNNGQPYTPNPPATQTSYAYDVMATISNPGGGEVFLDVFYNPARIERLALRTNEMSTWPENTIFSALNELDIQNNSFKVMPNFKVSAPNLKELTIRNNPLYAGADEASNIDNFNGTPQEQLLRLPSGIEFINDRGCWDDYQGDLDLDYSIFRSLEDRDFGNDSFVQTSQRVDGVNGAAPKVFDCNLRADIDPTDSSVLNTSTGVFTYTNSAYGGHGFLDGDKVRYKNRVAGTDLTDKENISGTLCEALSPFTRNEILQIERLSATTFKLRQAPYGAGNVVSSYTLTGDTGTFHTLEKWNDTDNKLHLIDDGQTGITQYDPKYTGYVYVPVSYTNSSRMTHFGGQAGMAVHANDEYRYIDNSSTAKLAISHEDREVLIQNNDGFKQFSTGDGRLNMPDFTNFTEMTQMLYRYMEPRVGDWSESQHQINSSKLTNTPKLETCWIEHNPNQLNMTYQVLGGDASNIFANRPELRSVKMRDNTGTRFVTSDTTFANVPKLNTLTLGGVRYDNGDVRRMMSPIDRDFFCVGNTTGRTGNLLPDQASLSSKRLGTFIVDNPGAESGRLVNETDNISALKIQDWRPMNSTGSSLVSINLTLRMCQVHGRFPNFSNNRVQNVTIERIGNHHQRDYGGSVSLIGMAPGEKYMIYSSPYTNTTKSGRNGTLSNTTSPLYSSAPTGSAISYQEWEDFGWSAAQTNSNIVSWGDSTARTGSPVLPKTGDWLVYQEPTVNECIEEAEYVISDVGNTSLSQWQDLGWIANNTVHGTGATPKRGDTFIASSNCNRINLASAVASESYTFLTFGTVTSGGNLSHLSSLDSNINSSSDTQWKDPFNPTSNATNSDTIRNRGTYLIKDAQHRTDFGTGKVVRNRVKYAAKFQGLTGFITGANNEISNLDNMTTFKVYDTYMEGNFPKLTQNIVGSARRLSTFNCYNNKFSGPLPDFRGINNVRTVKCYGNLFDAYTSGSLTTCTQATLLDFSNNNLPASTLIPIIEDLFINYTANSDGRNSVTIKLQGNNFTQSDLGPTGTGTPKAKFDAMVADGWSFNIPI